MSSDELGMGALGMFREKLMLRRPLQIVRNFDGECLSPFIPLSTENVLGEVLDGLDV